MLSRAKRLLLELAHPTGINGLVGRSGWRDRQLLILCYHSVALHDEAEWDDALYCTSEFLRRRFELLRESGTNVLPLGDALRRLQQGTLPPRSVVLTFDDGSADFPHLVVPLLQEFGYPATVYPSTYYCDRSQPIWNVALQYLLWRGRDRASVDLSAILPGDGAADLGTSAGRQAVMQRLRSVASPLETDGKHEIVGRVATAVGVDFDEFVRSRMFQLMTSDEMAALPADLVSVQLHTHRHRTPVDRELFDREIEQNRAFIAARRGVVPTHFCYPSGEYRLQFVDWLRQLGIESATTCTPALVRADTNPLLAPRFVDTMGTSESVFRAWLSGAASLAPRRRSTGVPEHQLETAS